MIELVQHNKTISHTHTQRREREDTQMLGLDYKVQSTIGRNGREDGHNTYTQYTLYTTDYR